jgi:hypothetical protein
MVTIEEFYSLKPGVPQVGQILKFQCCEFRQLTENIRCWGGTRSEGRSARRSVNISGLRNLRIIKIIRFGSSQSLNKERVREPWSEALHRGLIRWLVPPVWKGLSFPLPVGLLKWGIPISWIELPWTNEQKIQSW